MALRPHVVASLALRPVHRVRPAVQAGRHLEGPDELGRPDATGALRHDPGEAHLSPQVDLKTPGEGDHHHTHTHARCHVTRPTLNLDPRVPVVEGRAPGVDQPLVVEAGQLRPPALQPQHGVAHR